MRFRGANHAHFVESFASLSVAKKPAASGSLLLYRNQYLRPIFDRRLNVHNFSPRFVEYWACRRGVWHQGGMLVTKAFWSFALGLALGGTGCGRPSGLEQPEQNHAKQLHSELDVDPIAAIPVPAADGPALLPLKMEVPVYERPQQDAPKVGYLRLGARVPRSAEPVGFENCPAGWYAVRPIGFVCAEDHATTDLTHPLVRAIDVEPQRAKPMPYAYAFVRSVAPNYLKIPDKQEQFKREMRLERHLRNYKRLSDKWDALEVGANDVPLDEQGYAIGGIPSSATSMDMSQRYGGDGSDQVPWWLEGGKRLIPNVSSFKAPSYSVMAGRIKRHAGVAVLGTFVAGEDAQSRRFAITTDARLIPADKLKADSGSPFHGYAVKDVGLPVAFARKTGATWWQYEGGKLKPTEHLGWREFIPLTGKVKRIAGVRMVEARNGKWLRSEDLKTAVKPSQLPWFASKHRRWIQISILSQTLVLWEGDTPVYATLVSSGRDGIADPSTTWSTPLGTFRVYQKHVTTTMDSEVADSEFELRDVPWVQYFKGGYAIHAAYWHDDFGRPRSHGCVNLSPVDARVVFQFTSPDVPEHWHGSEAGDAFGEGTIVHIVP